MLPACCICGSPVLGLEGQDTILDTFYLLDEPEDNQAVAEEIFGDCHQTCLSSSGWGAFWARRKVDNFLNVRRYRMAFKDQDTTLLRDPGEELTVVARQDGVGYWFSDDQFARRERVEGGYLLPVEHDLNLDLSNARELADLCIGVIERQRFVPLRTVVDRLGVRDRLLVPEAIEGGALSPSEDWADGDARAGLLSMRAAYHIHMGNGISEVVRTRVKC